MCAGKEHCGQSEHKSLFNSITSIHACWQSHSRKEGVYFITFACVNRLPLFKICNVYDAVYTWFNHLKRNGHYIIDYVIMPGHVHAVIAFNNTNT